MRVAIAVLEIKNVPENWDKERVVTEISQALYKLSVHFAGVKVFEVVEEK